MVKNLLANAGDIRDAGLIPGLGRSPGGGHGNPFQYSCLENPMIEELGRLPSMGSQESDTTERLSIAQGRKVIGRKPQSYWLNVLKNRT